MMMVEAMLKVVALTAAKVSWCDDARLVIMEAVFDEDASFCMDAYSVDESLTLITVKMIQKKPIFKAVNQSFQW